MSLAMRKVVVHGPGGLDRLRVEEHPTPEPGPGEVRVATRAVGVNFADLAVRMGMYTSAKVYVGWPITPGFEFAGAIDAVGADVSGWRAGDEVFGVTRFGGYASHVVVPAHQVRARPAHVPAEAAAGFPTVFLTAWYALHELAHPHPGDRLLVHSAAGGVGQALGQLGRLHGCRMVGVVNGAHKVAPAREAGFDAVIDKGAEDLWEHARAVSPEGYAVVFDANGVETLRASFDALAPGGKLVVYGFATMFDRGGDRPSWPSLAWRWLRTPRFDPLQMTSSNRSVMAFNLSFLFPRADLLVPAMDELLTWLADGRVRPLATTAFPLDRVAEAHRALHSGETVGKLVLVP